MGEGGGQAATVRGLVVPEFDCSLCPRRWLCAVAALARRERRWLLYAGATAAVHDAGGCRFDCAASVLDVGCVPSPRARSTRGVAGFYSLVLPPPCAVQGCKFDCVQPLSSTSAVCRRRARSTRASLAFSTLVHHRRARGSGASLIVCSLGLRSRLRAVAVLARRERRWLLKLWCCHTAVRGQCRGAKTAASVLDVGCVPSERRARPMRASLASI